VHVSCGSYSSVHSAYILIGRKDCALLACRKVYGRRRNTVVSTQSVAAAVPLDAAFSVHQTEWRSLAGDLDKVPLLCRRRNDSCPSDAKCRIKSTASFDPQSFANLASRGPSARQTRRLLPVAIDKHISRQFAPGTTVIVHQIHRILWPTINLTHQRTDSWPTWPTTYELWLLHIVCTPVVPTADMKLHNIEIQSYFRRR